jgi:hypothetical protein
MMTQNYINTNQQQIIDQRITRASIIMKSIIEDRSNVLDAISADLMSMGIESFHSEWSALRIKYEAIPISKSKKVQPTKEKKEKRVVLTKFKKIPSLIKKRGIIVFCSEYLEKTKNSASWNDGELADLTPFNKARMVRSQALVEWKSMTDEAHDGYKTQAVEKNEEILVAWRLKCKAIRDSKEVMGYDEIRAMIVDKESIRKMGKSQIIELLVRASYENLIDHAITIKDLRKMLGQFYDGFDITPEESSVIDENNDDDNTVDENNDDNKTADEDTEEEN